VPFKSNVVPATLASVTALDADNAPLPENCNVPALMVVALVKRLTPASTNFDVPLFCVSPVTFVPMTALISVLPVPLPEFVTVPALFTEAVDKVIPLAVVLLLLSTKLPLPVTPPDNVNAAVLLLVSVVPLLFTVNAPVTFKADVALLAIILVILEPTAALIRELPEPLPEFVIVPVLLIAVPDKVIPLAVVLLLLRTRLPVPVMPPVNVNNAVLLFVRVMPLVRPLLIVNAEVALFPMIPVTFEPIAALMVVVPEPAPMLVMVPALFNAAVAKVIVPVVALLLMVKLLLPVTPPLNVVEMLVPVLPIVSVPDVLDASAIAFA